MTLDVKKHASDIMILCCIRKYEMSKHMLHTNMKCVLPELMVHTKPEDQ